MQLFSVKVYDLLVSEHMNFSGQNKKWLKYVEVCVKSVEALAMIHPAGWCGALETRTKFTETRTNLTETECKDDETCENMSWSDLPSSMFLAYSLFKRSLQRSLGASAWCSRCQHADWQRAEMKCHEVMKSHDSRETDTWMAAMEKAQLVPLAPRVDGTSKFLSDICWS